MLVFQKLNNVGELVFGNPTIFYGTSIYDAIYRVQNRRYVKKQNRYIADFGPDIL